MGLKTTPEKTGRKGCLPGQAPRCVFHCIPYNVLSVDVEGKELSLELGRLRQEVHLTYKDCLVFTVSSRPVWARARICSKKERQAEDCWGKILSSYHIPIL